MRRRVVWSIVATSAIALLLLGIPLAASIRRLYLSEETLRLEREASEARTAINTAKFNAGDPVELRADGPTRFGLYTANGRKVSGHGPREADEVIRRALHGDVNDTTKSGRIVVALPLNGNERVIGAIRADRTDSIVTDRVHRAWLVMGAVGASALLVSMLLAWWQARRLTRPIDDLVDSAERLGAGDFTVRTPHAGIPELDELGHAMDVTAERLGTILDRERAFSADASHQLRTPIAALRVAIETALMDPNANLAETLERLLGPVDRLESTVDDLLVLARDTHQDHAPIDIVAVIDSVAAEWRGPLAAEGRPLRVDAEADLPAPSCSAPATRQVLDVLVANATRHGRGVVTIRARSVPGALVVDVEDEGAGIDDPGAAFARRSGDGHGIGLSLARSLAEAEGGRLILERTGPRPVFSLVLTVS